MSQVVATRSIQTSFPCPTSGSVPDRLEKLKPSSSTARLLFNDLKKGSVNGVSCRRSQITAKRSVQAEIVPVSPEDTPKVEEELQHLRGLQQIGSDTSVGMWSKPTVRRKTKIVCTIGPSTSTKEMIGPSTNTNANLSLFISVKET